MNITVIGSTYPYKGGISHFTTLLVRQLRREHAVEFISWKRQFPSFLYPVEPKDTVSKKPIQEQAKYVLDYYNPLTWLQAFLLVKRHKSDLLSLNWVGPVQAPVYIAIALLVKLITRTKICYVCHNVTPHEPKFYDTALIKLALRFGDIFIVHSKEEKKQLARIVDSSKILLGFHPIYDVFNTGKIYATKRLKKQLKLKKHVLLFFGFIRPYKGLLYLIAAMPKILTIMPEASLLVVGEFWGKDRKRYFELIESLGLENNITVVDRYIPNEEVGKYFSLADAVVLPYTSATGSGIIKIAQAFQKPVVTTYVGGLKDIVPNGSPILFAKPADEADLADKVLELLKKPITEQPTTTPVIQGNNWQQYIQSFSKAVSI